MKMFAGTTNYGASYKLNQLIGLVLADSLFEQRLATDVAANNLTQHLDFDYLFIQFSVYPPRETKKFFPVNYLRDRHWRHLPKKREYVVSCDIDLNDWSPRARQDLGLPELPSEADISERFYTLIRIIVASIAMEFGAPLKNARNFAADIPVDFGAACTSATRKRRTTVQSEARPSRYYDIPLEVSFPLELDRAAVRSLLEDVLVKSRLGRLDGWSSGPNAHEVGYRVKDSSAAIASVKQALAVKGYDLNCFQFEAEE